jgi:hypothetical protein
MEFTDGPGTPPAWIEWRGRRYYKQKKGHYRDSGGWLLHRHVWMAANGDIPERHVIHHIDHDKSNNRLDNLQCMPQAEHIKHHALDRHAAGAYDHVDRSSVSKKSWANREPRDVVCQHCGCTYQSTGMRPKYCTRACSVRARRQRLAAPPTS